MFLISPKTKPGQGRRPLARYGWAALALTLLLGGCGDVAGDLLPSAKDERALCVGTVGPCVGQQAPDFTLTSTQSAAVTLSGQLNPGLPGSGVLIYFTMWCPVCNSHAAYLNGTVMPAYPNLKVLVTDFVSGSVAGSLANQNGNGFAAAAFTVLADNSQSVLSQYQATMAVAVVIDKNGKVVMNEGLKDGARLIQALNSLP